MAHSFSQLRTNIAKIWNRFTPYFLHFVYWFGFPAIFFFGKFKHTIRASNLNLTILICSFPCRLVHAREAPIFPDGYRLCTRRRGKARSTNDDGRPARHDVNDSYCRYHSNERKIIQTQLHIQVKFNNCAAQ